MNYLPIAGYWFYGATNSTQRAVFFSSWGLLSSAPSVIGRWIPTIPTMPTIPMMGRRR